MTDETRLYNCGGVPVELTLPQDHAVAYDQNGKDFYQVYLHNVFRFGDPGGSGTSYAQAITSIESFIDYLHNSEEEFYN